MALGTFIPASHWSGSENKPVVLFRELGGSTFSEVHRHSAIATASGDQGFVEIDGRVDGEFLVAVGRDNYKNGVGNTWPAVLSWFDGESWQEATVPSTYRFMSVYCPSDGVAYIGGWDVGSPKYARIWYWEVSAPAVFTEVHNYYINTTFNVSYGVITGSGPNNIFAKVLYEGAPIYNPSTISHYDGDSWSDANIGKFLPVAVSDTLAYGGGFNEHLSQPSWCYRWVSGVWSQLASINPEPGDEQMRASAAKETFLLQAWTQFGSKPVGKWTQAGGLETLTTTSDYARGIAIADNELDIIVTIVSNSNVGYKESDDQGETWGSEQWTGNSWRQAGRPFFADVADPPAVSAITPTAEATAVAVDSTVTFDITTILELQEPWSVDIDFKDGAGYRLAMTYDGEATFESSFQGVASAVSEIDGGYRVVIDPIIPFSYGSSPLIRVTAQDTFNQEAEMA
jgi:hypothetical protein